MNENILLRAGNITKSYAGVQALKSESFELRAGEVHALIGSKRKRKFLRLLWDMKSVMGISRYKRQPGGPPRHPRIDGSVVPCAAGGSLMFTPDISIAALREMKEKYRDKIYGRYGFADAFNPMNGWVNPDVIGIDVGTTLLSAENLRSGKVWHWFMQNKEITNALDKIGLK